MHRNEISGTVIGPVVQADVVDGGVHFYHHDIGPGMSPFRGSAARWRLRRALLSVTGALVINAAMPASIPHVTADAGACSDFALGAPSARSPLMEGTGAFLWRDQLHLFTPSEDGRLRHWSNNPPNLSSHFEGHLGFGITGRPATVIDDRGQHIYARSIDGRLVHFFWNDGLSRWFRDTWANDISGDPTTLFEEPDQNAWVVNQAGELVHILWNPDTGFRNEVWGSHVTGRPSGTIAAGVIHLAARFSSGTIGYWRSDGVQPSLLATFGDGITGDPVIAVTNGAVHVWAVDGQQQLWHWRSEERPPWQGEIWGAGVTGRPSVVLAGKLPHVFTRSAAGVVEGWSADGSDRVRRDRLGEGALADPTAIWFYGQEHVFTTTQRDLVQHWWSTATCGSRYELLGQL